MATIWFPTSSNDCILETITDGVDSMSLWEFHLHIGPAPKIEPPSNLRQPLKSIVREWTWRVDLLKVPSQLWPELNGFGWLILWCCDARLHKVVSQLRPRKEVWAAIAPTSSHSAIRRSY